MTRPESTGDLKIYLLGCLSIGRKADFESANLGSSPNAPTNFMCLGDGTGRHAGFKTQCPKKRESSTLSRDTNFGLLRQWQTTRLLSAGMKVRPLRGPPRLWPYLSWVGNRPFKPIKSVRVTLGLPNLSPCRLMAGHAVLNRTTGDRYPAGRPVPVYGMQRATVLNTLLKCDTSKGVTGFDSLAFLHDPIVQRIGPRTSKALISV
jgi:hypothetical protein